MKIPAEQYKEFIAEALREVRQTFITEMAVNIRKTIQWGGQTPNSELRGELFYLTARLKALETLGSRLIDLDFEKLEKFDNSELLKLDKPRTKHGPVIDENKCKIP